MTNLSPGGGDLPGNTRYLDWKISTFTVSAGAVGGTFEITNSRKNIVLGSAYNVANTSNALNFGLGQLVCKVTTNTTDNTTMFPEVSVDGGTTWSSSGSIALSIPNSSQNKILAGQSSQASFAIGGVIVPSNTIIVRLVVNDATDPTTDILTLTNIRVTLAYQYLI